MVDFVGVPLIGTRQEIQVRNATTRGTTNKLTSLVRVWRAVEYMPNKPGTYFCSLLMTVVWVHERRFAIQVAAEGGLEPGPSMTSDDGSGGESRGIVRLAELRVLPVSYYTMSYKDRSRKERGCGRFRDGA